MPKGNWGSGKDTPSQKDIDGYDRSGQRYMGPLPRNGAYRGTIKTLRQVKEKGKFPSLRPGLELVPRDKSEKRYKGYFVMDFLPIKKGTEFRYVPFLDAIGVSGTDFLKHTKIDEDGNVLKIGKWVMKNADDIIFSITDNDGEQADKYPKQINGYAPLTEDSTSDDEDEEADDWDDEEDSDEEDSDEDSTSDDEDDWDDEESDEEEEEEEEEPEPPRKKKSSKSRRR
ncbi:MAG: hypothetical protein ACREQA_19655 [Candidatus Binatia bacterium]